MKNTRNFILRLVLVNLLLCSAFQYTYAQNVSATQNPPAYNNGQIQYNVSSSSGSYEIYTDNKTAGQTLLSSNYNGGQITYPTNEPGIYFAKSFGDFGVAAYKPFEIKTTSAEPSDFDAYWSGIVNQLPAPTGQITNIQTQGNGVTTADLRLDNINGKKVYCRIAYPTNGNNMGAVLHIQSFSSTNTASTTVISAFAAAYNVIAISISGITDVPYGQAPADTPPSTNPDDFYYKTSIAASYQALRYIASRSDYSASKGIGLFGASQGAGLSLMVGGIDAENDNLVKCLVITQPILCDNSAILFNKAAGFPNYVLSSGALDDNAVAAAAAYYDATHAAKRISDPVYFGIGYRDFVTHPAGNFAAFNELRGSVHLTHAINEGHNHAFNGFGVWTNPIAEMFFERYINGINVSPSGSTVYFVDAGPDKTVSQGGTIALNGTIDAKNAPTPSLVQWSCIDCPATPNFSNANSSTTNATFPSNGTYTLRFGPVKSTGNAADKLYILSDNPNLYHTAADYVVVTVGSVECIDNDGDGFCQDDDCDDFDASIPTTPDTSCDDGNPNTSNDVIQADGCTCQGTITPSGNCAIDLVSFTRTTDSDPNCDTYKLTIASSATQTTATTVQISNLPGNGYTGNTAGVGTLSWAGQTAYTWNIPANSNGVHLATFSYCWTADAAAQATFNEGTCNETITVGGGGCTDNDSDGVCADIDCDDNDASIPTTPNTSCDDSNPNTSNDVIQADGCTCQGTITPSGNCAIDLVSFTRTTDSDPNCDTYELTIASSAAQTTATTVQISNLPGNGYTGNTAGVGTLSWAGQTAYTWNIPANSNGVHLATFNYCWAANAAAQATFNEDTCNETIAVNNGNKVILNPDDITLFPNPAENEVYLTLEALAGKQGTIAISNSLGQMVQDLTFDQIPSDPVQLDISRYSNGLYFVSIKMNDSRHIVKKLLINNFH